MKNKLKSLIPALNFLLPIVIYIAASLMAFVFWNHNHYYNPGLVWITNILLCIVGSFLCGFYFRKKRKNRYDCNERVGSCSSASLDFC